MAYKLSALDSIHVSVVLEDSIDQLAILGKIMTTDGVREQQTEDGDEVVGLVEKQKTLEAKYEEMINSPINCEDFDNKIATLTKAIHQNTQAINKSFRRNKFPRDAGQKIRADQKFLSEILESTLNEINKQHTFHSLIDAVNQEKEKEIEIQSIVEREEASRKHVTHLQKAIVDNRKEKETELQNRNELIAHLKDQLQETKAKTNMESKYIKKETEVRVACTQKKCQETERQLKDEISNLKLDMENEARCNTEIENYLRQQHSLLEEKVEYWMDKYDVDVENKQHELDTLKSKKSNDLSKLHQLTQKYHEYSKVVEEDKIEKNKVRREQDKKEKLEQSSTLIQSWWRGIMVRKQLGPYKPKKKGKKKGKAKKAKKK